MNQMDSKSIAPTVVELPAPAAQAVQNPHGKSLDLEAKELQETVQ